MLIKPVRVDASTPLWFEIDLDRSGGELPPSNPEGPVKDLVIQRSQSSTNSVLRTLVNVFETKSSPYRILLCFRNPRGARWFQIAAADNTEELQRNITFVTAHVVSGLKNLEEEDRERWALDKVNALLASDQTPSYDGETSPDAKVRLASRAFHSHFDLPDAERLLYFCSAAYSTIINPGWLYVSANHLCFYSFILGTETKVKIELKDIEHLKRTTSKGFFADSIMVSTKSNAQHFFCNLLHRDETFDILEDLTNRAMTRMLESSAHNKLEQSPVATSGGDLSSGSRTDLLEEKRHNLQFQTIFNLPADEGLLGSTYAVLILPDDPAGMQAHGRLFMSAGGFLCFLSSVKYQAQFTLPLFVVSKVEKLVEPGVPTVSLTLWHKMKIVLQLLGDAKRADDFLLLLKRLLQDQIAKMKRVKSFTRGCSSEMVLAGNEVTVGGLSLTYGGIEPKILKQRQRLKQWQTYFEAHGRNLTLIRNPQLIKLIRIGIPEAIRGEVWEVCSGSIFQRFLHPRYYEEILERNAGKTSIATEEIEKDLSRSLPEYPAYQTDAGIQALRRVLYAYSFHDPALGYCQGMNLLVCALLVYLEEEQAFWILTVLCDRLLPRYYTTTMIGAVVDSRVLESLVQKFMPVLAKRFKELDLELSIVCLPWFLSLFINALPLPLAYRVVDNFFLEGPRFLFQLALAILKICGNGAFRLYRNCDDRKLGSRGRTTEGRPTISAARAVRVEVEGMVLGDHLMQAKEDGDIMQVLKEYFATLDRPAADSDPGSRPVQRFTTLLLCAYKEFQGVTSDLVADLRRSHQYRVVQALDIYSKRSHIHELTDTAKFTKQQLYSICDLYFDAIFYAADDSQTVGAGGKMDLPAFYRFLGKVAAWTDLEPDRLKRRTRGIESGKMDVPGEQIVPLLFSYFNRDGEDAQLLTLQSVVQELGAIVFGDAGSNTDLLFSLFDRGGKGWLDRDDLVSISESLLFAHRNFTGDSYLAAVSDFLRKSLAVGTELGSQQAAAAAAEVASAAEAVTSADVVDAPDEPAAEDRPIRLPLAKFRALLLGEDFLSEQMAQFGSTFHIEKSPAKQEAEIKSVGQAVDKVLSEGIRWSSAGVRRRSDAAPPFPDDDATPDGAEAVVSGGDEGGEAAADEHDLGAEAFFASLDINAGEDLRAIAGSGDSINDFLLGLD